MIKRIKIICLILFIMSFSFINVSAKTPYNDYTYWYDVGTEPKEVLNRSMYEPELLIDSTSLGISSFKKMNDVCTDELSNVYILDGNSRIVILDKNYSLKSEIGLIDGNISYDNANSVYVHKDNTVYICDTENKRVLHTTLNGKLISTIECPKSSIIPKNFDFRPTHISIDNNGYIYILSDGSYYGALLFSENEEFLGFYGANMVDATVGSVILNIKNRIYPDNVKIGNTAQKLPYCFVDITVDKDGFIYTCTGYTSKNEGQIRMLSPGTGKNILNSDDVNFVDTDKNLTDINGALAKQDLMNIEIDNDGFIYALESSHGKIFLYDSNCKIVTVFGGGMGSGTKKGNFSATSGMAISNNGDSVLVSDSEKNVLTVFNINKFGKAVKESEKLTINGDYSKAKNGWTEILKEDNNLQLAYSGLAKVYLSEGKYKSSMEYAKIGYDRETYASAFEYVRKDFLNKNFVLLFVTFFALTGVVISFLIITSKRKIVIIKNSKIHTLTSVMIHPSNTFEEIKYKNSGSLGLSVFTVLIYYVASIVQKTSSGFMFTVYDINSFNSIWVFVKSIGIVSLWIVSNWMICTLMGGIGKFGEITIVTCYSLWPLIIYKFMSIVLTNILLPSESTIITVIYVIAIIYTGTLLIIGMIKIHDFGFLKFLGTSILSVVMMAAVFFLIVMCLILVQQTKGFFVTLFNELITA